MIYNIGYEDGWGMTGGRLKHCQEVVKQMFRLLVLLCSIFLFNVVYFVVGLQGQRRQKERGGLYWGQRMNPRGLELLLPRGNHVGGSSACPGCFSRLGPAASTHTLLFVCVCVWVVWGSDWRERVNTKKSKQSHVDNLIKI